MNGKRRLATLLLALLLPLLAGAALAQGDVVSGTTVSGTVRVYLSSIRSLTSVDLTIAGSYSVGGDASRALSRGDRVTVSNSGGTLRMSAGGQTQTMGSRFKLRRHQTTGENGVRIAQARYPGSLYPGDIEFIANGGNVQIIVHVYMEDYMLGVLPYEMDNSFPLEALKAQAVAARTYALKKMSAQAATYDVVDTTSDQVYNGTPSGNARCRQAVQETACIIGTVGGDYMASYYTASNGGQTESVGNAWGSGSYSYLQVKDDPYDLRNGASIAKSVTLNRDGTTSVPALTQLLRTEAAALVGWQSVQIEAITSVTPHTPKYAPPSRVYTKVAVGLRLAGYGETTVTLDYFSQIEGLCGMSINVLKNETLDVTETASGFKLTARRFGHGVGMSQRGAQQMAAEGIAYDQILDFYYPGLVRTRYTMTRTILPALDGTAAPQPDGPVGDAREAIVTLSNPLDSLNLRKEANTSSAILARIPHGTQVTLLEMGSAWSLVQYGTLSGYVSNAYISVLDDGVTEEPSAPVTRGTATVALSDESQTLNLRAAPTIGSAVLARLRHGQVLTVLERYETWTFVQHGTLSGYVMNDYIVYDAAGGESAPQATPTPAPQQGETLTARVRLQDASSQLNLREDRSLAARVIDRLPAGERVTVLEWGAEWCRVEYAGQTGYCATDYLRFESDEPDAPSATAAPAQAEYVAIVLPSDGLNLRATASRTSGVVMTLPQGTILTVSGEESGGMLPVALGSIKGYVASEYVYVTDREAVFGSGAQTPAATPTPAPQQSERTASVVATSGLKLRAAPSTASASLAVMGYGKTVTVTGGLQDGFYPVRYGTLSGYASAQYLAFDGEAQALPTAQPLPTVEPLPTIEPLPTVEPLPTALPTAVPQASGPIEGRAATVMAAGGLNLREGPSQTARVLATLGYGVSVTVTGEQVSGFYPVRIGTLSGYASAEYLRFGEAQATAAPLPTAAPTPQPTETSAYRVVVESDNGLRLRAAPDTGSEIVYVLPYGMVLEVLGESEGGFLYVRWGDYTGYVSGQYVTPFGAQGQS